jgi:hypothetical protein
VVRRVVGGSKGRIMGLLERGEDRAREKEKEREMEREIEGKDGGGALDKGKGKEKERDMDVEGPVGGPEPTIPPEGNRVE